MHTQRWGGMNEGDDVCERPSSSSLVETLRRRFANDPLRNAERRVERPISDYSGIMRFVDDVEADLAIQNHDADPKTAVYVRLCALVKLRRFYLPPKYQESVCSRGSLRRLRPRDMRNGTPRWRIRLGGHGLGIVDGGTLSPPV